MEIDQLRYSPLWRYHDAACEVAISLLAFSRMDIASHEDPAIGLRARIMVKIMTDMHHFAFNARKAIELAGVHDGQVIQLAKDLVPASMSPASAGRKLAPTDSSSHPTCRFGSCLMLC
ncbi:hypothetical protein [Methylobacterium sp. J-077]|uniref:hypothetical protein n=1 Tax=Methylobacterium sp. J-077 TaxID=2836656 RepID=UPI001FB8D59D|nr:hypothetical protein [Methylobacterium sp. J-077]MCJ2125904.1 hypothetical protein [Methylobacterium sp. J-077]